MHANVSIANLGASDAGARPYLRPLSHPECRENSALARPVSTREANSNVKQAILATVLSVEKQSFDSVVVRLQSDALEEASEIISTGLNLETSKKRSGSRVEVVCKGNPMAVPGDKVPVIVKPENRD